jgi:hypothetical protein
MKTSSLTRSDGPMSRGKYLSLEEARKAAKLEQFAKEYPSEADAVRLKSLLKATQGVLEESLRASGPEPKENVCLRSGAKREL